MERTNAEFIDKTAPHTAEAERVEGGMAEKEQSYGKFKDAHSLLKAYESLEAEFTRRSQKLKAIEGELLTRSQRDKTEEKVGVREDGEEDFYGQYPLSSPQKEQIEKRLAEFSQSQHPRLDAYVKTLEEKLLETESKLSEKEQSTANDFYGDVVKEYLKKVALSRPKSVYSGGTVLTAPPNKPKTIAEASAIAKNYIKKSEP
ncbi:MAG: hypothetical protein E7360_05855 [Clostridiales bacterium]|nr:hypothetical protein [Clostridiales bacterium]